MCIEMQIATVLIMSTLVFKLHRLDDIVRVNCVATSHSEAIAEVSAHSPPSSSWLEVATNSEPAHGQNMAQSIK